jgi:hypothetical protein
MSIYDHSRTGRQGKDIRFASPDGAPIGSVRRLFGLLNRPGLRAPGVEEMTENMADFIAEDNERIRRGE